MNVDITSDRVLGWLDQFHGLDRGVAETLLGTISVVTADDFESGLTSLLENRAAAEPGKLGLYAEADVRTWKGEANRLFPEKKGKVRRAHGVGTNSVIAQKAGKADVGSEGVVANLITQLARRRRDRFLSHPGADRIRQEQIRRFVLVTDFVGSGAQAVRYLDAAWRLASVKSWKSYRWLKFEVVCYSATEAGRSRLLAHPSQPAVFQVAGCPTVGDLPARTRVGIEQLIAKYGPTDGETLFPRMGFGDVGALIAFSHGVPNNAPRLLFATGASTKTRPGWIPLFPERVTTIGEVSIKAERHARAANKLAAMHEAKLAKMAAAAGKGKEDYLFALVLVALKRKPRRADVVSARTGLTIAECQNIIDRARAAGWVDDQSRLTAAAFRELAYLREPRQEESSLTFPNKSVYVPKQLRAPVGGI